MMSPAYELVVDDFGDATIVQRALVAFHRQQAAALTVASHQRQMEIDPGVIDIDDNHRVVGYRAKSQCITTMSAWMSRFTNRAY
jgi:NDP-sugar pyrophosphorylase family protein